MTQRRAHTGARALRRAADHKAERQRRKQNVRTQKFIEEKAALALRTYDMGLRIPGQATPSSRAEPEPSFSKQSQTGLYLP